MTRYRCAKIEVKIDKRHQMLLILYSARVKIDAVPETRGTVVVVCVDYGVHFAHAPFCKLFACLTFCVRVLSTGVFGIEIEIRLPPGFCRAGFCNGLCSPGWVTADEGNSVKKSKSEIVHLDLRSMPPELAKQVRKNALESGETDVQHKGLFYSKEQEQSYDEVRVPQLRPGTGQKAGESPRQGGVPQERQPENARREEAAKERDGQEQEARQGRLTHIFKGDWPSMQLAKH